MLRRSFMLFAASIPLAAFAAAGLYQVTSLIRPAKVEHVVPQAATLPTPPTAAEAPAVAEAGDDARPSFDVARLEPDGSAVFAGRAQSHARVELLANGRKLAETTANQNGEWALVPDRPLERGDHLITLRAVTAAGQEATSAQSLAVGIFAGKSPLVALAEADVPTRVLQVPSAIGAGLEPEVAGVPETTGTVSRTGTLKRPAEAPQGTESQATPMSPTMQLAIRSVDYEESGKLLIAGEARSGARLRAYLDDAYLGDTVSAGAKFTFSLSTALSPGHYRVRVDEVEPRAGAVLARVETRLEQDTPNLMGKADLEGGLPRAGPLAKHAEPHVVSIRHGDSLWKIAHREYGQGRRYTTIYEANSSQIRSPGSIYPDQIFVVPQGEEQ